MEKTKDCSLKSVKKPCKKILVDLDELREAYECNYSTAYNKGYDSTWSPDKVGAIIELIEINNDFFTSTGENLVDDEGLKQDILWIWCGPYGVNLPGDIQHLKDVFISEYGDASILPWSEEEWTEMIGAN